MKTTAIDPTFLILLALSMFILKCPRPVQKIVYVILTFYVEINDK